MTFENFSRASLAEDYLTQALDALRSSGSAEMLYGEDIRRSEVPMVHAAGRALAIGKRVGFSRTAVLFAALSAEAYINQHLDEYLSGRDLAAIDRLPTVEKYAVGTRLTVGKTVFDRGAPPLQQIASLFSLRDKLVHPKPRAVAPRTSVFEDPADFDTYNPMAAARFVVAVAQAAVTLASHSNSHSSVTSLVIVQGESFVLEFGKSAHDRLPSVSDPPVGDLVLEIIRRVTGRTKDYTISGDGS